MGGAPPGDMGGAGAGGASYKKDKDKKDKDKKHVVDVDWEESDE
jgi:hypothetical protein